VLRGKNPRPRLTSSDCLLLGVPRGPCDREDNHRAAPTVIAANQILDHFLAATLLDPESGVERNSGVRCVKSLRAEGLIEPASYFRKTSIMSRV
jgi:hypothetical protein